MLVIIAIIIFIIPFSSDTSCLTLDILLSSLFSIAFNSTLSLDSTPVISFLSFSTLMSVISASWIWLVTSLFISCFNSSLIIFASSENACGFIVRV